MRPWMANIIGLVLGFTIGGEALILWYSRTQQAPAPPAVVASVERAPASGGEASASHGGARTTADRVTAH